MLTNHERHKYNRVGKLLVASILANLVAKLDVTASKDPTLGTSHYNLVVGEELLHRFQHFRSHFISYLAGNFIIYLS